MQFLELQKLSDLDLNLGSGHAHIQLRFTHTPNDIEIGKTFFVDGSMDRRMDMDTPEFQSIRSLPGNDLKQKISTQ